MIDLTTSAIIVGMETMTTYGYQPLAAVLNSSPCHLSIHSSKVVYTKHISVIFKWDNFYSSKLENKITAACTLAIEHVCHWMTLVIWWYKLIPTSRVVWICDEHFCLFVCLSAAYLWTMCPYFAIFVIFCVFYLWPMLPQP